LADANTLRLDDGHASEQLREIRGADEALHETVDQDRLEMAGEILVKLQFHVPTAVF